MHFDTFKLFCDVAEHRSVSRAAELNGITQSAASQRLKALEADLAVQLIDRSTRPLQLTEVGEQYRRGCIQMLDRYHRLCEQIRQTADGLIGTVQVAAIYSAGIDLLNQVKTSFESDRPGVTVDVIYTQPDDVHQRVKSGKTELGILSFPERWSGLAHTPLREEAMVVVTRAGHPLSERGVLAPADLDGRDMVVFDPDLPIARKVNEYFRSHQAAPRPVQTFDNIDTIKGYVAQTDAAAILPLRTVQRDLARGTLATVSLRPELARPLGVVFARNRTMSKLAETFRDYLLEHQPSEEPDTAAVTAAAGTTG